MKTESIHVWRIPELRNVELHRGTSVSRYCPPHWHEEFHFCLIEEGSGGLSYRGANLSTPAGSLFIVHPGEVHANRAHDDAGCTYRNLYLDASLLSDAARELGIKNFPFFRDAVLFDRNFLRVYRTLHQTLEGSASLLEQESLLLGLLIHLLREHSIDKPSLRIAGREREAVRRTREYLHDNYVDNVSLAQLASFAGLSPFHLSRVFRSETGLPPHSYQTQVRINQAKRLLVQRLPIASVALATGFADQSHLTRHFKRIVGVPPGEFAGKVTPFR